jgi:hypothetical protein
MLKFFVLKGSDSVGMKTSVFIKFVKVSGLTPIVNLSGMEEYNGKIFACRIFYMPFSKPLFSFSC